MDWDVIVVGGGFAGCAAAAALVGRGRRVLVLEGRSGKNPRFNGELIHPTGVALLDELGLFGALPDAGPSEVATHGRFVSGFAVVPPGSSTGQAGADGERTTLLPYREIPGSRPEGFAMDHHEMVARLRVAVAARPGVTLRTGARVVELVREGMNGHTRIRGVVLSSGEALRARVVVAAEGRFSRLRPLLGIEEETRLLSFTAALTVEGDPLPHAGFGHIFLGAPGPILAYPIGPARVRMCIDLPVYEADGGAGSDGKGDEKSAGGHAAKGKANVRARLLAEYVPLVPEPLRSGMRRALTDENGAPRDFELCATHAIRTRRCTAPGIALLGDAAGCSHPLTATGMTICASDVTILADELAALDLPTASDAALDAALERYSSRRYRFVRAREILADALYEVFRGADDGTRAIRHGIFRYWQGSVRARAASMALLSGHDSRLASFLGEYWRVVALSTGGALRGRVNDPTPRGRARSLGGLLGKSVEKLRKVVESVADGSLR